MRTLTSALEAAQQAASIDPLVKIVLTLGATSYTYAKERILDINHPEEPYSQRADLLLDNSDNVLTDIAFQGFKGVISYGAITPAGEEYKACAPLWVIAPTFSFVPGREACSLSLIGIPNLMALDQASAAYQPDETDTNSAKTLINAVAGATLACFNHCTAYEVVWETGYNTLADTYQPKDSFRVYTGGSRLSALRSLLEATGNVMRVEADGKIHIFKPVTTGTTYDYEYSLASGHPFLSRAFRKRLVFPNYIVVKSQKDDDPQYSGYAVDSESYALITKHAYEEMRLTSNAQATAIAEALLLQEQLWSEAGSADVPLNIGAEIFDYIKVTDESGSSSRVGNQGRLTRHYNAAKKEWRMTFSFGNWMTPRKALTNLDSTGSISTDDLEEYFTRLRAKDAYIENLLVENIDAVWIDDEGNIDLDKIGDTIDSLADGPYFARARSMHLDAETGLTLKENQVYYIRFTPDTEETSIRRQDSAPTPEGVGEYWIDTSGASSVIKRWTGSTWFTIDQDEIDLLNRGILTTHAKLASLSPDGLVLLDEVVVGTYGLIHEADLTAHHLKFSAVVDEGGYRKTKQESVTAAGYIQLNSYTDVLGQWYNKSGVLINSNYGIRLYGGQIALSTHPTYADAIANTNIQCYVGTDGKLYAGAGAVYMDANGLHIIGEVLQFKSGAYTGYIFLSGTDLWLYSTSGKVRFNNQALDNIQSLAVGLGITCRDLSFTASTGSFILPKRTTNPASVEGSMYLNTDDKNIYAYVNGSWQTLHNY